MDNLDDLDCPQFVSFNSIMLNNNYIEDVESSPGSSFKHDASVEMETEDNTVSENQSVTEDMQSNTYLDTSSFQKNFELSPASSEYLPEGYAVHCPKSTETANVKKPGNKINKVTKVEPFHFADTKKRKREIEHEHIIPLAEQVAAFQSKTPERFHTHGQKDFQPTAHWSPPPLCPKSPNLRAAKRARGVNVLSRDEQEAKELEEIKGYKFRARPVNPKILKKHQALQFAKKTPTKPKSIHLQTAKRAAEAYKKEESEKPYEFHAQPVPKAIFNGPIGLKEKKVKPNTEPKTPNFSLKARLEKRRNETKMNETCSSTDNQTFKALPAPANAAPFKIKHEKKPVKIEPFSFDSKDKERMMKKEEKIMKEIEKENAVFQFKAQPLPSPTPSSLPEVLKKPVTQPEPFNFHLEQRNFKNSFDTSSEQSISFKARPATVLKKPPFVPEKPPKTSIEVKEFELHTDVRAEVRQKLKEINDEKEREKELELLRRKQQEEELERQEVLKLRKKMVHKANPVRNFKPFEVKKSEEPLTVPVSPNFKTDERLLLRH